MLERPGDVFTCEELQKRLWPDTFVDVDYNLNTAINKIRAALGDSSENPRFVDALVRGMSAIFSVVALGLGCFWMINDSYRQMWHDKIAGTVVVKLPREMVLT